MLELGWGSSGWEKMKRREGEEKRRRRDIYGQEMGGPFVPGGFATNEIAYTLRDA